MKALSNFTHDTKSYKHGDDFAIDSPVDTKKLESLGLIGIIKETKTKKENGKSKGNKKL